MKVVIFALILGGFDAAFGVTHSLRYVYTGASAIPNFPEFTAVGLVDEEQFVHYNSRSHRMVPRQDWIAKSEGEDYWKRESETLIGTEQVFKGSIENVKGYFNQTGGIHTVQRMYGCEWDDETGTTGAHNQYGYDGSDYISQDFNTMSYVTPLPQAFITKQKWNSNTGLLENNRNYFSQICIEWLKKYVSYGKETLERKVPPKVSLLQKDSSSPLVCHATGFYPNGIVMTWQKDGQDVHEDVEATGSLPNGDGTLRARTILRVSPEDLKNHQFSCVVEHVSLKENMVKKWVLPTAGSESNLLPIIIGCVLVALLLVVAVAGFFVWKRKNQGYGKASSSDTDSENSGRQAPKA